MCHLSKAHAFFLQKKHGQYLFDLKWRLSWSFFVRNSFHINFISTALYSKWTRRIITLPIASEKRPFSHMKRREIKRPHFIIIILSLFSVNFFCATVVLYECLGNRRLQPGAAIKAVCQSSLLSLFTYVRTQEGGGGVGFIARELFPQKSG